MAACVRPAAMTRPDHGRATRRAHGKATLPRWVRAASWATARAGRRPAWRRSSTASARAGIDARAIDLPKRKAEDAVPAFHLVVPSAPDVAVGGHSYGGRVASLAAAEPDAPYAALVLFSYPLHPPGAPERTDARIAHWPAIRCPVLLLSGESDPFARIDLLRAVGPAPARRRAGDVPAPRAHAEAGPRRRPRPGRAPSWSGVRDNAVASRSALPHVAGAPLSWSLPQAPTRHAARVTPSQSPPECPGRGPHPALRSGPTSRRSTRSPRRPGRKELHCQSGPAASGGPRRHPRDGHPARASSARRRPSPRTRPVSASS